ncbi:MAG: aquaporin [Acidobacteria bacterium]|nr:aquaporin [Acidobacteriota bacterium]
MDTQNNSRILAAELVGTAVLMIGGPGTAILAGGVVGILGVSLAFGFSLLIMAYAIGPISGCHINPAVTLGLLLAKKINTKHAVNAWIGQIIGAVAGGAIILGIASGQEGWERGQFAANLWSGDYFGLGSAIVVEIVLTALLVMVVLFTTTKGFAPGMGGLAAGITLALIHLISIPVDNTSVNPARSLGAAVFADSGTGALEQLWAFIVFPMIGAVVGVVLFLMLDDSKVEDTMLSNVPGMTAARDTLGKVADAVD